MIKINLLPNEIRPFTRTPLPHIISLAVLAAVLFFMSQTYMAANGELNNVNTQIAQQEAALDLLAATVKEYEELERQKEELQIVVAIIQKILEDRTIWSEHLHRLTVLTPDNIWYSRIRLTSRRFTEEVQTTDTRGNPITERTTVNRNVLQLSGYATQDETGRASTEPLATNTTTDPEFPKMFELVTSDFEDKEFDGYPVREFNFEYVVRR